MVDKVEKKGENALQWFNSHPVVATVLWALGAEVKEPGCKVNEKKSTLTWRDEKQGLKIVDFMSPESQGKETVGKETLLSPRISASAENKEEGHFLKRKETVVDNGDVGDGSSFGEFEVENTSSPNWGFFVAITPPQDHYARGEFSDNP